MTIDERLRRAYAESEPPAPGETIERVEHRLATRFDTVAETVDAQPRAPRASKRPLLVSAIAVALVVAVIAFVATRPQHATSSVQVETSTSTTSPPDGQTAAVALARQLLDSIPVPAGAQTFTGQVPDRFTAPQSYLVSTLVEQHRFWSVPLSTADSLAYAKTHVPGGLTFTGGSGSSTGPGYDVQFVVFDGAARPADSIYLYEVLESVLSTGTGSSLLRVDVQVIWTRPHPQIPSRDRVVIVTTTGSGRGDSTSRLVQSFPDPPDKDVVDRFIAAFYASATQPDGMISHCPAIPVNPPTYTIGFAPALHANPDVVVTVGGNGCGGAPVKVDGADAPSIDAHPLLAVAQSLVGK